MVKVVHQGPIKSVTSEKHTQEVLDKMRTQSIEEYTALLAQNHGLRYLDLAIFPIEAESVLLVPQNEAARLRAVIFQRDNGKLRVAFTDPENNEALAYFTDFATTHSLEAEFFLVSESSLERALAEYDKKPLIESLDFMHVTLKGADLEKFEADFGALLEMKNDSSRISTSRILEIIIAGAYKLRSSDIHFEPFDDSVRLRYRIDGVLQEIGALPKPIYQLALSRVKMISKMKLNVRDRSQDGHFIQK